VHRGRGRGARTLTSLIERRRIEAQFAKALLAELERQLGAERALAILSAAVVRMAQQAGRAFAAEQGGESDLAAFAEILPRWQEDNALELEVLERAPDRLAFNVTRCRYAEMYRELGVPHLGAVLSCNRDGEFCRGYNPAIAFSRPQTIMEGAASCNFRYTLDRRRRDAA